MTVLSRRWPQWNARRDSWALAAFLAALALLLSLTAWTWRGDRLFYDFGLSVWRRPPPPDIVIVAIDDASVDAIGRWPWPRAVHSTLLEKLHQAKPRAIGLDLILSEADPNPEQDRLLAHWLRQAAPVVLPLAWDGGLPGRARQLLKPIDELNDVALTGMAEAAVDADGVLRQAFLHHGAGEVTYSHMALALMRAAGESLAPSFPSERDAARVGQGARPAGVGWRDDAFLIRYAGPPGHFQRVSYVDVLRGAVAPEVFANRYVLVGMTALGLGDTLATPVNQRQMAMPGVEVLSNTLYTLRSGDTLRPVSAWWAGGLAAALLVALVAGFERVGTRWALVLALVSVPLVVVASLLAMPMGWWCSPMPYTLAAVLAYPLWSWRRLERAVDSLDVEIRRLEPDSPRRAAEQPYQPLLVARRDRLASRLDTLHMATDAVRSARRFLADVLAGMPTAMVVADHQGRILLANTLAAQMFETDDAQAMQGLDLAGLLEEFRTPQEMHWRQLFSGNLGMEAQGFAVEAQVVRLGDLLLHFASLELMGEQRWVVTFADVTAIKQAQRRRDETLAFISHDLRSPASSIMMLAELQMRGDIGLSTQETLSEIRRLAERALQLSDDIVRLAHAESRPLNLTTVSLAGLLQEVMADFRPQALAAHVHLEMNLHDSDAHWVMDRALLLRALGNLLSNAIKHSPQGSTVDLRTVQGEERLIVRIQDSGPGLTLQQRLKLQNEAQGLPAGDARGVGLGLLFVQRVASRHRGVLLAHAGPAGVGTVAELQLGLLPVATEPPALAAPTPAGSPAA